MDMRLIFWVMMLLFFLSLVAGNFLRSRLSGRSALISGTVLTVTAVTSGSIAVDQFIFDVLGNVLAGTRIVGFGFIFVLFLLLWWKVFGRPVSDA